VETHQAHTQHPHEPTHSHASHSGGLNKIQLSLIAIACLFAGFFVTFIYLSGSVPPTIDLNNSQFNAPTEEQVNAAANIVIKFLNENQFAPQGMSAKITSIQKKENSLYEVSFELTQNGQFVAKDKVYLTADLNSVVPNLIDLSTLNPNPVELTKSDKPVAELYIFSYCPAGSAALESFAKAADVLKNSAEVKVKFFSNMHGAHELQQNMVQECIQIIDKNRYWAYAQKFVSDVYPNCGSTGSTECDKNESTKIMETLGIDSGKVFDCVANQGAALYQADTSDATSLQLQYSPSVVINGAYFKNADRTPEGLKTLICDSFNVAPVECQASLSANEAASSGSCS